MSIALTFAVLAATPVVAQLLNRYLARDLSQLYRQVGSLDGKPLADSWL
jgi:hypothetical protein